MCFRPSTHKPAATRGNRMEVANPNDPDCSALVVTVGTRHCQALRQALTAAGLLGTGRRQQQSTVVKISPTMVAVPLRLSHHTKDDQAVKLKDILAQFPEAKLEAVDELVEASVKKNKSEDKLARLKSAVAQLLDDNSSCDKEQLRQDLPASFELFDDLLLLPSNCLRSCAFETAMRDPVLDLMADIFGLVDFKI